MSDLPPNPGTEEAIKAGCICPVLDNAHGKGYLGNSEMFIFTVGCPVHSLDSKNKDTKENSE